MKLDRKQYGATVAFFALNRPNSIVESGVFSAGGEQQTQGVELALFGEPLPGLRLLGGATFLDAELARTTGGVNEGNTPIGIPDVQANLNIEWDVPHLPGVTIDGRVVYTDEQYINFANTFTIPSWTRLDLGARYTTKVAGRALLLSGRIENLLDRDYWASSGGFPGANYLVLGTPRTFLFSASVDF
jgi:iron complex outermembrane receptor protein